MGGRLMKLGLLTYNIAKDWDLDQIIRVCQSWGYAGVEFRAESGHRHGVEYDAGRDERKRVKEKLEQAYLEAIGIGTSCRFESHDPDIRQKNIDTAKRAVELAADIGAPRIRVFGNRFETGADKSETISWVGGALAELQLFARPYGVDVLLEMHGDFNYWKYAVQALACARTSDLGLVYNCDLRDKVGGSISQTYSRVRPYIKHVHLHALIQPYPYKELLRLLKRDGYEGFLSAEIDESSADAETVAAYYAKLFYELLA